MDGKGAEKIGFPSPGSDAAEATRLALHSWKEIAAYLRHSLRTVQRWEQTEDLPVHRHGHEKRDAIYAYADELDTWWSGRETRLNREEGLIPVEMLVGRPPLNHRIALEHRNRLMATKVAALLVLVALLVLWLARHL